LARHCSALAWGFPPSFLLRASLFDSGRVKSEDLGASLCRNPSK
jgi:hypothetical protein